MRPLRRALLVVAILSAIAACASGRVRVGQGTEIGQEEVYEPEEKVNPPVGNVDRTSGPLEHPDPYPVLEGDLERRPPPPSRGAEPKPEPKPKPEPEPGSSQE